MDSSKWRFSEDEDETYSERKQPRAKRRKGNTGKPITASHRITRATASLSDLLDAFQFGIQLGPSYDDTDQKDGRFFESVIEDLLPEFSQARYNTWVQTCSTGESGEVIRPLSRYETTALLNYVRERNKEKPSVTNDIILQKLGLLRQRRKANLREPFHSPKNHDALTPLQVQPSAVLPESLNHLRNIPTTRYENSFASRLYGSKPLKTPGLVAADWETRTPWMNLMDDVHEHHCIAYPERDQSERLRMAITYVSLQPCHLKQVHDLLTRVFWDGIDVSDSLQYSPERCTVVAMYGHLVVGVALLSSPQETYITYLAVRAGWDNSQIATTMLYHLISLNPHRDIILHVSANNPAMLLYNRFGFKAEEFVVGFYEDYLHSQSRASMNAFRLRLRR
ncbi:hypothetical protein SCLCIDRAFT_125662 [Scleroderma citrinum Foug A]|uniref:N-acetyltransferase domain-containing protein n=1 Tax=Scleroderma citrinum Foug A TaxID=1036808 RepID=A0A0C3DUU2_9AGAM|nr:hypothetical protein SCLCIDRAFT_125662 [Scleroderma citrinum Foug A]